MSEIWLWQIVKPIGSFLAIILIIYLWFKLIQSFKSILSKNKRDSDKGRDMKISVSICFITYILLNAFQGIRFMVFTSQCRLIISLGALSYHLTTASHLLFLVTTMQITFTGSRLAFSGRFIKGLRLFIVVFHGASICSSVWTAQYYYYNTDLQVCVGIPVPLLLGKMAAQLLVDLILSILCVGLFSYKLYKLCNSRKKHSDIKSKSLLNLVKKQCKLTTVAIVSSAVIWYASAGWYLLAAFMYIDSIINVFCIYCSFSFELNNKLYRYLCDCNQNRCLLGLFCFCCYYCNPDTSKENLGIEIELTTEQKVTSIPVAGTQSSTISNNEGKCLLKQRGKVFEEIINSITKNCITWSLKDDVCKLLNEIDMQLKYFLDQTSYTMQTVEIKDNKYVEMIVFNQNSYTSEMNNLIHAKGLTLQNLTEIGAEKYAIIMKNVNKQLTDYMLLSKAQNKGP